MKNNVFIRTDGGSEVGYGHIMRCIALAQMIQPVCIPTFVGKEVPKEIIETYGNDYDFKIVHSENEFFGLLDKHSLVVVDGYSFDKNFYKELKEINYKTISIQDVKCFSQHIDLVINHLPASQIYYDNINVLSGPKYAILRKEFLDSPLVHASPYEILISLGGTTNFQVINNLVEILRSMSTKYKINILTTEENAVNVRGNDCYIYVNKSGKEVVELIDQCSYCFITSGMISYEVLARNKTAIIGALNDGQASVGEKLAALGLAEYIGKWEKVNHKIFKKALYSENIDKNRVNAIFDGKSGTRILNKILEL